MLTLNEKNETIVPDIDETESLNKIESLLVALAKAKETHPNLKMVGADGEQLVLPPSALRALQQTVHLLAQGKSVTVVPVERELTTQEAADFLNVSRPYLVKLLKSGEIPFRLVGAHRRIHYKDMVEYKKHYKARQHEGLNELVHLSEEMGLYE